MKACSFAATISNVNIETIVVVVEGVNKPPHGCVSHMALENVNV